MLMDYFPLSSLTTNTASLTQLARLRTRFTFPAFFFSIPFLYYFIMHIFLYAWTTDFLNRFIPYQHVDLTGQSGITCLFI